MTRCDHCAKGHDSWNGDCADELEFVRGFLLDGRVWIDEKCWKKDTCSIEVAVEKTNLAMP